MVMGNNPPGRLAFRVEGNLWCCYYALPDTMDGALLIGSIVTAAVPDGSARRHAFMEMMKGCITEALGAHGHQVEWPHAPVPAPEHERREG